MTCMLLSELVALVYAEKTEAESCDHWDLEKRWWQMGKSENYGDMKLKANGFGGC